MQNTLLIALLAGLGGMLGWGFADFFAKKTVDVIGPIKSLVWGQVAGTVLFVAVLLGQILFAGKIIHLPNDASSWLGFLFFGALQMLIYWLVYQGFEKGQLAVLNPVFASYSGLVALFSVIFFGENLSVALGVALIAIFTGNILLNIDFEALRSKKLKVTPGLKEMVIAAILAAGWTLGWDKFVTGRDAITSATFMYIFMTISSYVLARIMRVKLSGITSSLWKFLALMGAGEAIAYMAISWGFSSSPLTGLIAVISGAFSVPAILLAYVFLKERLDKLQIASIVVIIAGIMVAALSA